MPIPWLLVVLIVPVAGAGVVAVARSRRQANAVAAAVAVSAALAVAGLLQRLLLRGPQSYAGNFLYADDLSGLLLLVVGLVGLASLLYSLDYLGRPGGAHELPLPRLRRYYALVFLFLFSMYLVAEANNLGVLWIALEGTTLVSALLVGYYHTRRAQEASWKYLILCSVGLAFALFGTLLLYVAAVHAFGSGNADLNWTRLVASGAELDPGVVRVALVFLFVGYGTKAGLAPLHTWLPDAHSEAPTPVSALLSGALLNCAMYALLRIDAITVRIPDFTWTQWLFLLLGLLSVFLAALFLVVQRDLKRLLAYSSVENMGIIAVGLSFGGAAGIFASLYHLLNHAATKSAMFLIGGHVAVVARTKSLPEIQGALVAAPGTGLLLLFGGLALAGVPPFSMFSSEFLILSAGFARGDSVAAGLLLLGLLVAFGALLWHLSRMLLGDPHQPYDRSARLGVAASLGIGIVLAVALGLGLLLPDPLSQLLHGAARVVSG